MPRKGFKPFKKAKCSGEYFHLKTKRGTRCACAAFASDGRFVSQFARDDQCSRGGKALTWKQAQRKFG